MDNIRRSEIPTGKDKGVLFILLDAFRWDYATKEDAPTIHALMQTGVHVKKLRSSSGFTQRSAIFTGALSDVHGNYTMYIHDPKSSPFKVLSPFNWLLRRIKPEHGLVYRVVRKFINQIPKLTTEWAPPGKIPTELLSKIAVVEDNDPIDQPGTLPLATVFDAFREHGIEYKYYMAPVSGHDEPTMQKVLEEIHAGGQVFFAQFSDTDGLVHKDGVASETRHRTVKEVDERVRKLKAAMEERFEDPWIIICGDHGMMDVHTYKDIWGPIEKEANALGLKHGKDYLMFLDSTLARFWFFNDAAREQLEPFVKELLSEDGEWMDDAYRKARSIPNNPFWYGELIWKADAGVGIFPDYFHGLEDKYIGMHGYDCTVEEMHGLGVISNASMPGQIVVEAGGLESMCATLCDLLELPVPESATGASFIPSHE